MTTARPAVRWPALTAAAIAAVSAIISIYWALGGTVGIDTVGGAIESMARSSDIGAKLLAWGAALVKVAGVLFALALIAQWGSVFPRRLLLVLGWAGATILVVYGGLLVVVGALAVSGLIRTDSATNFYALKWHLYLWDPLFLGWGIFLGLAVAVFQRRGRPVG